MKNLRKYLPLLILATVGIGLGVLILNQKKQTRVEGEEGHGHGDDHGDEHEDEHGRGEDEDNGDDHTNGQSVTLTDSVLLQSGALVDTVRLRRLAVRLPLQGKIVLHEDKAAHIHPRFPGVILEVRKQLGARVRKGEVLAVIESNESLRPYNVLSQLEGVVVSRHAAVGETVTGEDEIFTVADMSTVWVDFRVYRQDFNRLRVGQKIRVIAEGLPAAEVSLAYLSPSLESHSQSLLARVELPNTGGVWTPGLFVQGEAAVDEFQAPAIRLEAVQQFPEGPVIFVREKGGNRYTATAVKLGRRDGEFVELLSPSLTDKAYVSRNSFLLKAEMGKGEAGHDH